jgi:tetratricopeptide (TPR) repeat protein
MIFCWSSTGFAKVSEEALQTAVSLNYCHMSLFRIMSYNDRIVLDEEYTEIINNINLTKIQDEEIINLLKTLMDTISEFKLSEGDKGFLYSRYEQQIAKAFYASFSGLPRAVSAAGFNPYAIATKTLIHLGSAYSNYRKNMQEYRKTMNKALWELDKKAIIQLNEARKNFLSSYWKLMKKYGIPDKWRLTEKQMGFFMTVLKDEDPERKLRQLIRLENDFEAYPPFWYYLGQAAQDINQNDMALKAYEKFEQIQKGFFREDNFYSSVLMNKIELINPENDQDIIIEYLSEIVQESPLDFRKNLFAAIWYLQLKRYDEAKERLLVNIDNNKNTSINKMLLGDVYAGKYDKTLFEALVEEMIKEDNIRNQDILQVIGKMPELKMLQKMKDQITNIYVSFEEKPLKKDDLILTIPDKWILDDFDNFKVTMALGGQEYHPKRLTLDKSKRLVSYYFEELIDKAALIKNNQTPEVKFILYHPSSPITVIGNILVISREKEKGMFKKGYEETLALITQKKEISTQSETEKVLGFKKREIRTENSCYQINEKNGFEECQQP